MHEINGLIYGSEATDGMRVASDKDVGDFILLLTFSTKETRLVDCTELFAMPAFAMLADRSVFETMAVVEVR